MASSDVSTVTNHFSTANEGFITTLSSTILSGAATVPLTTTSGLTNGKIFVGIIEPGTVGKEQTFTGTVDTSGNQITGVKWTRGTNTGHNAGVTVVDYVSGTGHNMTTKGILVEHKQTGLHSDIHADSLAVSGTSALGAVTATSLTIAGTASAEGWSALGATPNTVTANGNRSYDLVFNANDLTDTLTNGMRIRTARTVAAPVQCTSLNGTTQYYSKSSPNKMTFTDDFVVSAWVKVSSYSQSMIVSRSNSTNGWFLELLSSGQVLLVGSNGGALNYSQVASYQSVPLNKWVHIAAQLDMSSFTATTTTSYIMIDGVDVPSSVTRSGTNPTALVQAGNLEIGSYNGGALPFPGKIAQVAIYNAKVTQATILASMNQKLAGTETNLASAYSFSNSITDLNTTTPNDLTANGSAVATNADSPFGNSGVSTTIDYGIVMAKSFSTNTTLTIQVPEGCTIPTSGGVASMDYSTQAVPYGFPRRKDKWRIQTIIKTATSSTGVVSGTWYNIANTQISIPAGEWLPRWSCGTLTNKAGSIDYYQTLSTANNTQSDINNSKVGYTDATGNNIFSFTQFCTPIQQTVLTPWYLNSMSTATPLAMTIRGDIGDVSIVAENAYL